MKNKLIKFLIVYSIILSFLAACENPEKEARVMLNQALVLKQDGKLDEAEEALKKVASQYPKTKVATEALKELEQMKNEIAVQSLLSGMTTSDYEDRKKCSQCEMDANSIIGAVMDYFSDPYKTKLPTKEDLKLTISNPYSISGDPNGMIIVQVRDASGRCPKEYQEEFENDERRKWNEGVFTFTLK